MSSRLPVSASASNGQPEGVDAGLRQAVDDALLQMAFDRLRLSVLLTVIVCLIFLVLFWSFFPSDRKIVWVGAMLAVSALRYGLWWLHARTANPAGRHRIWKSLFLAGAVAAGASWAYGPIVLMPAAGHTESMLLVLAVLAVSAVSMSAMGAQLLAMLSFQVAALVPTIFALAATGGAVEEMAAAVLLAGMASLMIVGRASSAATRSLIETELKLSRAVAATGAAREKAEAASQAKTRFLANMSHELRSPLNAVIGAAQLMKAGESDPERQEQLVDAIERSGSNLLGLIENILDLSRIEAGELVLAPQEFHLFDCVDAALATAGLAARAKGLQLACIADPELPPWRTGDAARLRQVLLNLLGNAVKFTDAGEIVVRVKSGEGPDWIRISVCDTGVGIRDQDLAHVFEPFRQADDSAGRRFGGTGLGLAIVQQLVEAMGGRVGLRSTLAIGTTIELNLPLPLTAGESLSKAQAHLRVAYFEPHQASADALDALLRRMGCEPRRCHSGQDVRDWCGANAEAMADSWLLVCTDAPQTAVLLEQALDMLEPERVIGMSSQESFEAEQARQQVNLPRNVIKPVSRSALASRFVATRMSRAKSPVRVGDAVAPAPADEPQFDRRILVVEDDLLNQTIVRRLLEHAGYAVSVAPNGFDALEALRGRHVDLVLMDWQMPDMDGLEATRRIRAGEAGEYGRHIPIVALTANAFAEDRDACLAAGMNDFLTKPVLAGSLNATIARWLPKAGTEPAEETTVAAT